MTWARHERAFCKHRNAMAFQPSHEEAECHVQTTSSMPGPGAAQRFSSPGFWEFAHLQETQRLGLGDACQRNDPRATQVPQAQGFMDLRYTQKFLRELPRLVEEAKMDPSSKPQVDISKPPGAPSDPPQRCCHPPFLFGAHQNPLGPRHSS